VLEDFLLDFPGNILVVSHDRYFMDKIIDHLFIFEGDGKITGFPGNYTDYRIYEDSNPSVKEESIKKEDTRKAAPVKGQLSYLEKREFNKLEKEIASLEKKKATIETMFAKDEIPQDQINEKSTELQKIIDELNAKEERWLELSMKME
jgi:ATP-binding cassette subfamily F protein uup